MQVEPTYVFVQGQGWVPQGSDHIVTMKCGTRVRLENRPPKTGEKYDCGGVGDHWGTQENPNWEMWEKWFASHGLGYAGCITAQANRRAVSGDVYMTAVPV